MSFGLLGKRGRERSQLGRPDSPDSGALEAGLLMSVLTQGLVPGCQVPGASLLCLGFLKPRRFSGWGHLCCISSPALVVL